MSAAALSKEAGFSPSYVSKVEKGDLDPSFRAVCKMLAILEASEAEIEWLVWVEGK